MGTIEDQLVEMRLKDGTVIWRALIGGAFVGPTWYTAEQAREGFKIEEHAAKAKTRPPKSRSGRWFHAIEEAKGHLEDAKDALSALSSSLEDLRAVRDEYEEWRDNLPENLQDGPTGEKLNAVVDIDIPDDVENLLDDVESALTEAEGADLPQGYGKD